VFFNTVQRLVTQFLVTQFKETYEYPQRMSLLFWATITPRSPWSGLLVLPSLSPRDAKFNNGSYKQL
jgi:hypothetical protein